MTEWIFDVGCIWKTDAGKRPCRIRLARPFYHRKHNHAEAKLDFAICMEPPFSIFGADPAQVKKLAIRFIRRFEEDERAKILDHRGRPLDLEAMMPISVDEYAWIEKVSPPGHPPDTKWSVDIPCRWVSETESTSFRLRISTAQTLDGGKLGHRISANHPRLGNLIVRDTCRYTVGHAIPDLADWHRAKILDEDGKPLDFAALAQEVLDRD